ncbi:MAG: glycosyltransferase [Actinomycetota bacterium]|nr:glycosyltransferase [Actinomycetota bacterium]
MAIRKGLRAAHGRSEMYAFHRDPVLHTDVLPADHESIGDHSVDDILIYHSSIGQPETVQVLDAWRGRIVMYFHNIVPFEYFYPYDPYWASLLALGRMEVTVLRDRAVLTVANSEYSADDLRAVGYDDIHIIPPVSSLYRLRDAVPTPSTLVHLEEHMTYPMILYVGQLLPQKRVDMLIDALHISRTYLGLRPTLMLAGPGRLGRFESLLKNKVRELALPGVHFTGHKNAEDLAALFRHATFLVTASDWESYCVPLVEAMSLGVPIIARATTVVPETLGGAGLQLPADSGAALMAEAFARVANDDELRLSLAESSTARFAELEKLDPVGDFIAAIGSVQ